MKNIFRFLSYDNLKKIIERIISRFPITAVMVLVVCVLFFTIIHWNLDSETQNNFLKAIFSLIITYFFSVWIYISWENLWFSKTKNLVFQLIPILFWIIFYFGFQKDINDFQNIIYIILTLVWIISFIFIAPYLKGIFKDIKQNLYYQYFYKISVIFLTSAVFGWVLFILWNIWIFSVISLFDLKDLETDKIVADWAVISLSFLAPLFALSQIPEKEEIQKPQNKENAFFSFLVKFIWIPFAFVYFLILYSYTVKVLLNFSDWPKWEVSWLVIWFSIFWYLIYIFSYIFENENKFINFFRKIFPFAVIPQVFMLFYAIWLRINQYDFTTNRYFVVVFGIWLLLISIYFIFSKNKLLIYIPTILALFIIIISIWPWSVYNFPLNRQYNNLLSNLKETNILQNWKIVALNDYNDINNDLSKSIYSQIDYVCSYDNCNKIKELFNEKYTEYEIKHKKDFEESKKKDIEFAENTQNFNKNRLEDIKNRKYFPPSKWQIVSEITEYIKVKSYFEKDISEREFIYIYMDNQDEDLFPLNITWYNKIYSLWFKKTQVKSFAKLDTINKTIEINDNWIVTETIDISQVIDDIYKKYNNKANDILKKNDLEFIVNWRNWEYKLIIISLNMRNPLYKWDTSLYHDDASWYLLTK